MSGLKFDVLCITEISQRRIVALQIETRSETSSMKTFTYHKFSQFEKVF